MKRLLATVLSFVMIVTMMPATAFGADGTSLSVTEEIGGKLYTSKKALLQDDGTYTIKLEAFSTGDYAEVEEEVAVPLDIVIVMDQSGSMTKRESSNPGRKPNLTVVKEKAAEFINAVYANGEAKGIDHRIAIAGFASGAYEGMSSGHNKNEVLGDNTLGWINTGVFLEDGTFKNIVSEEGYPGYTVATTPYSDEHRYFAKNSKGEYIPADKCTEEYRTVTNPKSTDEVYGFINGKYEQLSYVNEKITYEPVKNSGSLPQGEYFQDPHGAVKLNWGPQNPDGTSAKQGYIRDNNIINNSKYYFIRNYANEWRELELYKIFWIIPTDYWVETTSSVFRPIRYGKTNNGIDFTDWNYDTNGITYPKYSAYKSDALYPARSDIAVPVGDEIYKKTVQSKGAWVDSTGSIVEDLYQKNPLFGSYTYIENGVETAVGTNPMYVRASGISNAEYKGALRNVQNPNGKINQSLLDNVKQFKGLGGTRTGLGFAMANEIFANNPIDRTKPEDKYRQRIILLYTDGVPKSVLDDAGEEVLAVNQAKKAKQTYGAEIYAIGLGKEFKKGVNEESKGGEFLNHLSSNYPYAEYTLSGPLSTSEVNQNKKERFVINLGERYAGVVYNSEDQEWQSDINGNHRVKVTAVSQSAKENPANNQYHFYRVVKNAGKKSPIEYTTTAEFVEGLNQKLFKTILEHHATIKHPFYADGTSIFRDIITEDFRITNKTKVVVNYQKGEAPNAQPNTPMEPKDIVWGDPIPQLTLELGKGETEKVGTNGVTVKIAVHEHGTHTQNAYQNMDIIDVSGFDYGKYYVGYNHPGYKITVAITGIQPQPTVNPGGATVNTNHPDSGVWVPGGNKPEVPMDENPDVKKDIVEKTFVQDYAKPVDIGLSEVELSDAFSLKVAEDGVKPESVAELDELKGRDNFGELELKSELVRKEGIGQNIKEYYKKWMTYTPKNMNWNGADTFFVFGLSNIIKNDTDGKPMKDPGVEVTNPGKNPNAPRLAMVNVVPANNIYYEDSFVSDTSTGQVGIHYGGKGIWEVVGSDKNNSTSVEPEPDKSAGDAHGWIPALNDDLMDTGGSSHHINTKTASGKVTFTFTGDRVDIYSRTSPQSAKVYAKLLDSNGKRVRSQYINTTSVSGEYYQIPALSFPEAVGGKPLPYGQYTVELTIKSNAEKFDFYLDGIRVYNPLGIITDESIMNAYGPDESNAVFKEIRQQLIDSGTYDPKGTGSGLFIDQIMDVTTGKPALGGQGAIIKDLTTGEFVKYGPKNEVYLSPGQQITLKVNTGEANRYQVGIKALEGKAANVSLTGNNSQTVNLGHSAEMYYKVVPDAEGYINIVNKGLSKVSVTQLKVTNVNPVNQASIFDVVPNEDITKNAMAYRDEAMPLANISEKRNQLFDGFSGWF